MKKENYEFLTESVNPENLNMKDLITYVSKSFILEQLLLTGKLNEETKDFVVYEMDYENAVELFHDTLIQEASDSSDINKTAELEADLKQKIKHTEDVINKLVGGISGAAAGVTALTNMANKTDRLLDMGLAGALGYAVGRLSWYIISKIVKYFEFVLKSQCLKRYGYDTVNYYKCQSMATQKVINTLKSNLSKCKNSTNPKKCQEQINQEIEYYTKKKANYDKHVSNLSEK